MAPEIWLSIAGLLTFVLVPIHFNTIYSGLPAHPLFLHVPVILIPVVGIAVLVLAVLPRLFTRHGVWIAALTVVALGSLNLTMGAGDELRHDLNLNGGFGPAALIARHAHAASILRLLLIGFTALLIVAVAIYRQAEGRHTGYAAIDGVLRWARPAMVPLRAVLAILALACLYFVFHTGDLGAKAVWRGRVGSHRFGAPGGFPPGLFPGGGGSSGPPG